MKILVIPDEALYQVFSEPVGLTDLLINKGPVDMTKPLFMS